MKLCAEEEPASAGEQGQSNRAKDPNAGPVDLHVGQGEGPFSEWHELKGSVGRYLDFTETGGELIVGVTLTVDRTPFDQKLVGLVAGLAAQPDLFVVARGAVDVDKAAGGDWFGRGQ